MARLNEPAAPVESLESLKRRFVRQNRDLARHNSQQSLKIRMLESELARLRAENVVICEENIQLHTQLDDIQRGREPSRNPSNFAEQEAIQLELESKVKEFDALVHRLGDANARSGTGGERKRRRKSEILAASNVERLSPGARRLQRVIERGEASVMKQAEMDEESRMPAIFEGASYPRRTLETSEMQRLLMEANSSESPDFGPPPTTFFDREQSGDPVSESQSLASVNLERRRRRSTMSRQADTATEGDGLAGDKESSRPPDTEHLLRVGAKRKWDSRNQKTDSSTAAKEEVSFGRVTDNEDQPEVRKDSTKQTATLPNASVAAGKSSSRKVLAPKPVNNDPVVSPRKNVAAAAKDKPVKASRPVASDAKPNAPLRASAKNRVGREAKAITIAKDEPAVELHETVDIKLEPKTPGLILDDIFSPSDSRILDESARPDTPPPMTTSAGGIEGPTGLRGTRRARAQVSYAEPSLNTKMRRAGDKMDAVAGAGRQSLTGDGRSRSVSVQPDASSSQKDRPHPTSARLTSSKRDGADFTQERKIKIESDAAIGTTSETLGDTLSARLNALVKPDIQDSDNLQEVNVGTSVSNTRKRQSRRPSEMAAALRTLESTDVFDVTDSPSSTHSGSVAPVAVLSSSASRSTLSRPTNRRQTLAGNLANTNNAATTRPGSSGSDKAGGPKISSARSVVAGLGAKINKDAPLPSREPEPVSRAERIAARRRSMML